MGFLAETTPPQTVDKNKQEEFKLGNSKYGIPIPEAFGTVKIPGNVIWATDVIEEKNTTTQTSGGKGLGPTQKTTTVTWTYYANFAVAFCKGPVAKIVRLWADTKVIYERFGGADESGLFRMYNGDENQRPDPLILANKGPLETPAFRDLCYIVFERLSLEDFGNRIPTITAEIICEGTTDTGQAGDGITITTGVYLPESLDTKTMIADYDRGYVWAQGLLSDTVYALSFGTKNIVRALTPETTGFRLSGIREPDGQLMGHVNGREYMLDQNTGEIVLEGPSWRDNFRFKTTHAFDILDDIPREIFVSDNRVAAPQRIQIHSTNLSGDLVHLGDWFFGPSDSEVSNSVNGEQGAIFFAVTRGFDNGFWIYKTFVNTDGGIAIEVRGRLSLSEINAATPEQISPGIGYFPRVVYDRTSAALIFFTYSAGGFQTIFKWNQEDGVLWTRVLSPTEVIADTALTNTWGGYNVRLNGVSLCWTGVALNRAICLDTRTGDLTFLENNPQPGEPVATSFSGFWDSNSGSVFNLGPGQALHEVNFAEGVRSTSAWQVVTKMLQLGGVDHWTDIDENVLPGASVAGFIMDGGKTLREYIQPLMDIFRFDIVESDFKLKIRHRTGTPLETISESAFKEIDEDDSYQEVRVQEAEVPFMIEITHIDRDGDYQENTQRASRSKNPVTTVASPNKEDYEVPAVLSAQVAADQAQILLSTAWLERTTFRFSLSWRYIHLDVGDVIRLAFNDGRNVLVRIESLEIGVNLECAVTARSVGVEQFVAVNPAAPSPIRPVKPPIIINSNFFAFDTPYLRDEDDIGRGSHLQYVAGGPFVEENWTGAGVYDVQTEPVQFIVSADTEAPWGMTTNIIGAPADPYRTDTVNFIDLTPVYGADRFETRSELDVLNGANLIAVEGTFGSEIAYELIQFQTVTALSNGKLRLSNLLRGRRGTEVFTLPSPNVSNRKLVLLDVGIAKTHRIPLSRSTMNYGWATFGQNLELLKKRNVPLQLRSLRPYAPTAIKASLTGADIAISWLRRTRVGGALVDGVDTVPLNEDNERYDVEIVGAKIGGSWTNLTVPRQFSAVTTPNVTYTNSEIIADFGSMPTHLRVRVYQLSVQVGRGFTTLTEIEVN